MDSSYEEASEYETKDEGDWATTDLPLGLCCFAYMFNILFIACRKMYIFSPRKTHIREYFVLCNIDFCIHRYGEWVMLGESILSLLIVETTESKDYYMTVSLCILIVIVLQAFKFESEPSHADGQ